MGRRVPVSISIDEELLERLDEVCRRARIRRSHLVEGLIENFLRTLAEGGEVEVSPGVVIRRSS